QTQRSLENFMIGEETMPRGVIRAFAYLKKAAAAANRHFRKLDEEKYTVIANACDQILAG
ncbi:MAG TPA: class II fumarate hydratase, partial [Lachnospiraceae bacterium]|nr:class II fumarate hydratase [Lachnospiraceae bacterium]